MKVYIHTFGCQMNVRDSEAVHALLLANGYEVVASEIDADVMIVNTCSVRDKAEQKALGKLRCMVSSKQDHPLRIVGAIGCMAEHDNEDLFRRVKGLDFAIGPRRLASLPSVITALHTGKSRADNNDSCKQELPPQGIHGHTNKGISAFVTVVEGCSRGCAYCVVPKARGPERSRTVNHILEEIDSLVDAGIKEVTLLGQSVGSYGRDSDVGLDQFSSPLSLKEPFPRLLERVASTPDLPRVRFTSSHPSGITEELIRVMKNRPTVCEHVHLPLQSGSDRILKMMRRGYDASEYRDAARRLQSAIPGIAITTDIIIGFPTETDADFNATRSLMQDIQFDNSYIFKYSPRPHTDAALSPDDVPQDVKRNRHRILLEDQDLTGLEINKKLIGHEVEVLIEGVSQRNSTRWSGRTRTNKIVIVEPIETMNDPCMVDVRVERGMPQTLHGKVVRLAASYRIKRSTLEPLNAKGDAPCPH